MARYDITVAGGAACSAATLTARHGPDTCLIDAGDSPLRRDAHLENFSALPPVSTAVSCSTCSPNRLSGPAAGVSEWSPAPDGWTRALRSRRQPVSATPPLCRRRDKGRGRPAANSPSTPTSAGGRGSTGRARPARRETPPGGGLCRSRSRGGCDSPRGRRPAALPRLGHTGGLPHRPLSTGCEGVDETERREREAVSPAVMRDRFAEPHPDHQATHASLEE